MEETKNPAPSQVSNGSAASLTSSPSSRPRNENPRGPRPERTAQRRGRFGPRPPKTCPFCAQKVKSIDYKAGDQLRRYLTDHGKIKARRKIGTCAKHQRRLALAIKRARHVALLPFTLESTRGE